MRGHSPINAAALIHSADGAQAQQQHQDASRSHRHYLLDRKVTTRARFELAGKIKTARTHTNTHTRTEVILPTNLLPVPNESCIVITRINSIIKEQ